MERLEFPYSIGIEAQLKPFLKTRNNAGRINDKDNVRFTWTG